MNAEVTLEKYESRVVTVEGAAWAAVGLLAALLRLYQLGLRPLGAGESLQALAAYRFSQGMGAVAPAGTVPGLFAGNVLGFTLLGASDIAARWLPVVAGIILVLLPYGLRHRLGRGGALAAAVLLALSPLAMFFSRSLDSAIVVAACGLALVVGLINYLDFHRPRHLYLAAVALGLGLVSGPAFITLLVLVAAFALVLYAADKLLQRGEGWSSVVEAVTSARGASRVGVTAGVVVLGSFALAATAFALHPAGIGHAADLIGAWVRGFLPEEGGQPLIYPLLVLLRYEPLILVLSLVEMVRALVASRREGWTNGFMGLARTGSAFPHTAFLSFWAIVAFILVLVAGHRPVGNLLLVVVPLALLAGQGIERAVRWISRKELWFDAALIGAIALGLGAFLYLQLVAYARADATYTVSAAGITLYATTTYLVLALVSLLLLVALGLVAWLWRGPRAVLAGGWLALVVVLGLFGIKAMWSANFGHPSDPRELLIGRATAPEVRLFVDQVEELSLAEAGDAHTLRLTVDAATGPVVAWYLREFGQQEVVEGLDTPPDTIAAVTLAAEDLPIGETFRGTGFPLESHWLPWGLRGQSLVRWLLFTEGSEPVVDERVVLWVGVGGAQGSGE